ncbi:MAG: Cys-tRNA(Pro) deacylase [Spirochaetaceae bacterium]|jgi:Cys-tRNA(Pro)/Cys-tRNA(Cys) deacylase|nr:Cys-tRNA(Pro) deacylase [Spirochaetaceae bacterium]
MPQPVKTNVMRLLDAAHVAYELKEYPVDEDDLSAVHAAALLGVEAERIFKTLVLQGASGEHYVCCIPADATLNLKLAAAAFSEKSIALIHEKELLPLTGYVRGGCSPIGMKKKFLTLIDETAILYDSISISAGKRGAVVFVAVQDLLDFIPAGMASLV